MKTSNNRFWRHVDKNGPIPEYRPDLGPCWLWTGAKDKDGYGRFRLADKVIYAHAFLIGKAPNALQWDHLCRTHACINPDHLEAVTHHSNILRGQSPSAKQARQTHCLHGHPLADTNLYIDPKGKRYCRVCKNRRARAYRAFSCNVGKADALERMKAINIAWDAIKAEKGWK